MVSDKYTRIQYDMMKEMHDDLVNHNLDLEKELRQLKIRYNHLTDEYDKCKAMNHRQEKLLSSIFKIIYNDKIDDKLFRIKNILLGVNINE